MPLEIASFTPASALLAATSGAHRIELCTNAHLGGTTPSLSDFQTLKSSLAQKDIRIPINVMIRPRGGDFAYSDEELIVMEKGMDEFGNKGADGFVFGLLTPTDEIDVERCKRLIALAGGKPCTFHRAFDLVPSSKLSQAVEDILGLGFTGILTSGGASDAVGGKEALRDLVARVEGRGCEIIVGGGVRAGNVGVLQEGTGARWFHSSAILGGGEADEGEVKRMVKILEHGER